MAIFDSIRLGSSAQGGAYEIERSVRLFRTDNAKFSKTFSSAEIEENGLSVFGLNFQIQMILIQIKYFLISKVM